MKIYEAFSNKVHSRMLQKGYVYIISTCFAKNEGKKNNSWRNKRLYYKRGNNWNTRFFKDVHVLFQESSDRPGIYVVVAACNPPMVVTVCRTKDEIWEVCNGILKRRKKGKWVKNAFFVEQKWRKK